MARKLFDILSETVIEDGLIKETITVNGVTGSIYYEEIKLDEKYQNIHFTKMTILMLLKLIIFFFNYIIGNFK